jgi:hypothetical protein
MKDHAELIKKAEEWANVVYDESEIRESERTEETLLKLCKATSSHGYAAGYAQCRAEVKEQIEAVIKELGKIRKDHAGLGIVTALLRGIR